MNQPGESDTIYNVRGISPADTAFGNLPGDSVIFFGVGTSYLPTAPAARASDADLLQLCGMTSLVILVAMCGALALGRRFR